MGRIKVEVLFPDVANLYGDLSNIEYLKKSSKLIEVINTEYASTPYFVNNEPDLIYMGTMTESAQILVIKKLAQYRDRIIELVNKGTRFLITGNALEVFGEEIRDKEGEVIKALNILPIYTERNMMKRFNSLYVGKYKDIDIVGFKSQFTQSYFDDNDTAMIKTKDISPLFNTMRGTGLNPETMGEGLKVKNFMATYIIGPLNVLNPYFTKKLLEELGLEGKLAFEHEAIDAFNLRLKEYMDPNTGFTY